MMNRWTAYLRHAALLLGALTTLAGCTAGQPDLPGPGAQETIHAHYTPDGKLAATLHMEIPGLSGTQTRSLGEAPDYHHLRLYLLVFEQEEGLTQYDRLTPEPFVEDENHGHRELIRFSLSLDPTENPVAIHLIATNQPNFEKQIVYGTEERLITSLYTADGYEAYWQRLSFDYNIPSAEQNAEGGEAADHAQAIGQALSHVPMIRNFCRVSVKNEAAGFSLTGLYVLNTVDKGAVAPYVSAAGRFVDYYDEPSAPGEPYSGKCYADVSAQGHIGTLPSGVQLINMMGGEILTKSEDPEGKQLPPVYFYERPARINSTERTYVILRGHLDGEEKDSYYKLDLGYVDESFKNGDAVVGRFAYYDLLRNFDYVILLKAVQSKGHLSMEDASNGAVFNNFSAATEARTMTSISDGEDMIFVKFSDGENDEILFTSYVFTQPEERVILKSQYRTVITNGDGGEVHNELIRMKFDPEEGDPGVIADIKTLTEDADAEADGKEDWNAYEVTGGTPTEQLRQQTVYIYRGNKAAPDQPAEYGLYRIITFFAHTPWPLSRVDTFPGLWEDANQMPSTEWSDETQREIGQSKGSPLTLFFELPSGLPQALFPLEFVIESDRQNIQNAYAGNAVVRSVPAAESLFYDASAASGNPTTTRIQYVKTVTWKDYFGEHSEEQIGKGSSMVRCRFLTITDLAQDGVGGSGSSGSSTTLLRIYNPYFGQKILDDHDNLVGWQMYHEDGFTRSTATSDPSPRFWDFNSAYWDQIMYDMNQSRSTALNVTADELNFREGSAGTMRNDREGVDKDGLRYVRLFNNNDMLRHSHSYPMSQDRVIRLRVVSTDDSGTPTPPRISFTGVRGGTVANPSAPTRTLDADGGKKMYVYDIDVDKSITSLNLDIMAPEGTAMRFYKIDFYPRWGDFGDTDPNN